jgi:hypothetical protein
MMATVRFENCTALCSALPHGHHKSDENPGLTDESSDGDERGKESYLILFYRRFESRRRPTSGV